MSSNRRPMGRAVLAMTVLIGCAANRPVAVTVGARQMVVAPERIAAREGARVLHEGGNALDAAVCVGFVIAVTHPAAGNLGGGGFLVVHTSAGDTVVDARESAPAAAAADMYLDANGNVVKDASLVGPLAAGVPGSVAGYEALHRLGGKLPWARLLAPAIRLAEEGVEVDRGLHEALKRGRELLARYPETAAVFLPDGRVPQVGDTLRQPALARTLQRIADHGAAGFYTGPVAEEVERTSARYGGVLTASDLAAYRVRIREPLRGTFRGREVLTMPPPSSGGAVLLEMLGMVERVPYEEYAPTLRVHYLAEASRRAFADRAEYFGDPDFVDVPVAELLSSAYLDRRARSIDLTRATPSAEVSGALPRPVEQEETCHFSVVDADGNAVSCTTTLNGSFGCGASAAGFLLNNEMDDFTSKPGVPNLYGLVQSEKNAIAPFKRPLSSMTPTILLEHGEPVLVLGSPGGPTIISTVCEVIIHHVLLKRDLERAVAAPRTHHQWLPDRLFYESLQPDVRRALKRLGHELHKRPPQGDVQAAALTPGGWVGVSDPRGRGGAAW